MMMRLFTTAFMTLAILALTLSVHNRKTPNRLLMMP